MSLPAAKLEGGPVSTDPQTPHRPPFPQEGGGGGNRSRERRRRDGSGGGGDMGAEIYFRR